MFITTLENKTIHFIGIAGSGMIGLAQALVDKGHCHVSGSDLNQSDAIDRLIEKGITFYNTHLSSQVKNVDIIVISSAIPKDNPEWVEGVSQEKTIYHRAEFLGHLMGDFSKRLIIAGTHGKTTTTGMMISVFHEAGLSPSFNVGGQLNPHLVNGLYSGENPFIAESDESDGTFLIFQPTHAILTNIEADHMSYFQSKERLYQHFDSFISNILEHDGLIIANNDDPWIGRQKKMLQHPNMLTYSTFQQATCRAENITYNEKGSHFDLYFKDTFVETIHLNLFGLHNIYNALSVSCLCLKYGLSVNNIQKGLLNFFGVQRRLQLVEEIKGIRIYDDYGHHPTEINTTLKGIKTSLNRPLTCIFQPHRYSRTSELIDDFSNSFEHADNIIITSIYSANETPIEGVSSQHLVDLIKSKSKKNIYFIEDKVDIIPFLSPKLSSGDVVITMGAGDINLILDPLILKLKEG